MLLRWSFIVAVVVWLIESLILLVVFCLSVLLVGCMVGWLSLLLLLCSGSRCCGGGIAGGADAVFASPSYVSISIPLKIINLEEYAQLGFLFLYFNM